MPVRVLLEDAIKVYPHKRKKVMKMEEMFLELHNDGVTKCWYLMGIDKRGKKSVIKRVNSKRDLFILACLGNETSVGNFDIRLYRPTSKFCWGVFRKGHNTPLSSGMSFDEAMLYAKRKNDETYNGLGPDDKKEAINLIKAKGKLAHDVAVAHEQSLRCVQGMKWFVLEVAKNIKLQYQ